LGRTTEVKIAIDTNMLVRVIVRDDERQSRAALRILAKAETVAIPLPCLCEVAWVLSSTYGYPKPRIAAAIESVVATTNVEVDRTAVGIGLRIQANGGDFADGVIASLGVSMGGEIFVSFDRKAVARLRQIGMPAELASTLA
jgi:predicted nucleic-acid-binding protein